MAVTQEAFREYCRNVVRDKEAHGFGLSGIPSAEDVRDGGADAAIMPAIRSADALSKALWDTVEAADGAVHFSDAVNFRTDTLSLSLKEWLNALGSALSKLEA